MITRRFGRTELPMPIFSCGGMRYQQSWQDKPEEPIDPVNQANLEATIHRALELGINHIETARGYGSSERQLGLVLPLLPRESLIIQTKVPPKPTGREFIEVFNTSMDRLQLDYVDLLSLHGINNRALLETSLAPNGSLAAARQLQREGRVRHIGFSTHGPVDVLLDAVRTSEFDYLNLHWYWVNQINTPVLAEAQRLDLGVFIISPNDKGGKLYAPSDKLRALCQPLSPMVFNDLFCLARPEIHTLSLGAARPEDFDEHMKVLPLLDQAEELTAPIVQKLEAEMQRILGAEWVAHWAEGLPDWTETPGQVNLWEILRLWNLATSLDLVEFAKMRYNLLGQAEHWFPGENAAHADPQAIRPLLNRHFDPERVLEILPRAHQLLFTAPAQRLSAE
jgi:predicted aldo/keto reductase-like oxidoreductase